MLLELYLLQTYFAEQFTAMYEEDLVQRYGRQTVSAAIKDGMLEHRRIPCGKGDRRCVCRLSDKGLALARTKRSEACQQNQY